MTGIPDYYLQLKISPLKIKKSSASSAISAVRKNEVN
jgi:hypothetical protein